MTFLIGCVSVMEEFTMNMNITLKRALVSILAAAAISSVTAIEADTTTKKSKHIVIKGTGRNITVKQSNSAPVSTAKAAQMNKDYQKGYDAGYKNANNTGFRNGYSAGQVKATGGALDATDTPVIDKSDFGGTAPFQSGYRAGYNAGYTKSFDVGMVRGYNAQLATENAIAAANTQPPVAAPVTNNGVTIEAATTSLGIQQFGSFAFFRPVLPNAPQPPVLSPIFGRLR